MAHPDPNACSSRTDAIAVGGVGGSGTRVLASLLRAMDVYIGDDLNPALDNLWFTLLFRRRSALLEGENAFQKLVSLFFDKMAGRTEFTEAERKLLDKLAARGPRRHWLEERRQTFLGAPEPVARRRWGWKEPNSHVFIEKIISVYPQTRYVHLVRNPFETADSRNRNQLRNWGPLFLDREVEMTRRDALKFWCSAHRRLLAIRETKRDNILIVDYATLCTDPIATAADISRFANLAFNAERVSAWAAGVTRYSPKPTSARLEEFDDEDVSYAQNFAYSLLASSSHPLSKSADPVFPTEAIER